MSTTEDKRRLERELRRIEESDLSPRNQRVLLEEFLPQLRAEGMDPKTIQRYLMSLRNLQHVLDYSLDRPPRNAVRDLVAAINADEFNGYSHSAWGLAVHRKAVRRLYIVLDGDDERVDWISTEPPKAKRPEVDPRELPDIDTVSTIIDTCENIRNAFLIFFLFDSGMRISEALSLNWGDLSRQEHFTRITLREGKTGPRIVPAPGTRHLQEYASLYEEWRRECPATGSGDPVLVRLTDGERATYSAAYSGLKTIRGRLEDADILPDYLQTNFHAYRKGRATDLARRGINAPALQKYAGWDSLATAQQYIRLADQDVEEAILKTVDAAQDTPATPTAAAVPGATDQDQGAAPASIYA